MNRVSRHALSSSASSRRKEAVEVEGERVELLVPAISFELSKPRPPWHPSVTGGALEVKRVVQEHRDDQRHRRRRGEDRVDVVIELQQHNEHNTYESRFLTCHSCSKAGEMQTSASDTHPFRLGVGWTVLCARSIAKEVLRNGQAEEDGDARDEEVAHGVHVGELQQGKPHRSWNRNINHDLKH
ncbi:hypothetical protein BHE74_00040130 [Ensete ventricosum]|uniref:Uncharacterized protein n=1 Tax=Ensete ventricosum TaxID=4639 RepID=A0A426ZTF9_ENSVE|nr:hypothetical protein B296_00039386 [Ensete ventricosum]RWW53381.1 hypothetical protein BHE74_00040130 [Ensete ventricosum]RZS15783.1 hypothetical protein BHM03_00047658 [Ensete ventricosum]